MSVMKCIAAIAVSMCLIAPPVAAQIFSWDPLKDVQEALPEGVPSEAKIIQARHRVLRIQHGDPWVYGVLVNNIWSLTSDKQGGAYNNGLIQPFVNYNFPDGFYLTSAPILTVNWKADSGQQWMVPMGGGIGKIFHLGKLPVNTQLSAYYNVAKPDFGANWQIRAQVQLMFPK